MSPSLPSWTDRPRGAFSTANLQLPWRSIHLLLPHRIRRKLRSKLRNRQSPASSIATLQTSFSPSDTIRALQSHRWSLLDGQYLLLAFVGIFSLCVIQSPGALVKTAVATLLLTSLVLPVTRQFFLPFLPVAAWLFLFDAAKFIPSEYRPPIWVRVLPALENIFYGANLSNILSAHKTVALDVLAWLPYGIIHFAGPFLCALTLFVFAPPTTVAVFARSLGYVNLAGVMIQILFPCSAPWYENMYGLAPANYAIQGSPAGLARIDQLFGIELYHSTFTASPLVFGAFPSLHAGNATIEALFLSHVFPRAKPLFIAYTLWLWWATMYLSHHYAVDLVGGSLLSAVAFYYAKSRYLPRIQADKATRWDYDFFEVGDAPVEYGYDLARLDGLGPDPDEWTIGSSSSISSGSMSPADEAKSPWENRP